MEYRNLYRTPKEMSEDDFFLDEDELYETDRMRMPERPMTPMLRNEMTPGRPGGETDGMMKPPMSESEKPDMGENSRPNCRGEYEDEKYEKFDNPCMTGSPLAMVYAPCQEFERLHEPEEAICRGTLFKDLDFVFYPGCCVRGGSVR